MPEMKKFAYVFTLKNGDAEVEKKFEAHDVIVTPVGVSAIEYVLVPEDEQQTQAQQVPGMPVMMMSMAPLQQYSVIAWFPTQRVLGIERGAEVPQPSSTSSAPAASVSGN